MSNSFGNQDDELNPASSVKFEDDTDSDKENIPIPSQSLINYGADYTLDSIYQYVTANKPEIVVQPEFQRRFVWDIKRASKLIESFLLGFPIPNILLGRPQGDGRYEVIDGQQRIMSIVNFIKGKFDRNTVFKLTGADIDRRYQDKTFEDLAEPIQRKFKNAILKAVIVVYPENADVKFSIFQRINTGSVTLNQQEIRNCIFGGKLNNALIEINEKNKKWRKVYSSKPDKRMKDIETVLRFLAGYYQHEKYEKPLNSFLNKFMDENINPTNEKLTEYKNIFEESLTIIIENIGDNAFSKSKGGRSINRAMFESIMIAIARLNKEKKLNKAKLKEYHTKLLNKDYYINSVTTGTADKKKYQDRISIAYKILSGE